MEEFELNCWVLGDGPQELFEVTIPKTTVSELLEIVLYSTGWHLVILRVSIL
jgi:hypothetical protein